MVLQDYLPSKKFIYILLVVLLVFVIGLTVKILKKNGGIEYFKKSSKVAVSENISVGSLVYSDKDGDGLWDWEESLWGTDPNNPDTNGDGIGDKEAVDAKRPKTEDGADDENLSETSIFARNLFSTLVSLNESGSLTEENLLSISTSLADSINNSQYLEKNSIKDLSVVGSTESNKFSYQNTINKLFDKYYKTKLGKEMEVIPLYLEDPVTNQVIIEGIIEDYKNMSEEMVAISVPEDISIVHLSLINALYRTSLSIQEILYLNDDPLRGLAGLSQHEKSSNQVIDYINKINNYIKR